MSEKMPEGWKRYSFTDIAEIIGGGTPSKKVPEYWNGDINWLTVNDFNHGRKYVYEAAKKITTLGLEKSNTKILKKGQIIISARGTVGAIAVLAKDMAFNQSNYGIVAKEDITFNDFIYYLLQYKINELKQVSYGAVFDTITKSTFENLEIIIPESLDEQRAIAQILSSLDDKIDLLHRQNKTLEQMAETLFRKWFIEDAKEDWEEGVLSDEFNITMGQAPPGNSYNEQKKGMPLFQGNANFDFRFPKNKIYTTKPKKIAQKYDTLISVRAPVGKQNMAFENCCIGRGLACFRYKYNKSFYTYTYFKLKYLMKESKQYNETGTVFGAITQNDINNFSIIIPPKKIVEEFLQIAKPIDDKIIENCIQIRTLEKLRDTLLPKLISGEVRLWL